MAKETPRIETVNLAKNIEKAETAKRITESLLAKVAEAAGFLQEKMLEAGVTTLTSNGVTIKTCRVNTGGEGNYYLAIISEEEDEYGYSENHQIGGDKIGGNYYAYVARLNCAVKRATRAEVLDFCRNFNGFVVALNNELETTQEAEKLLSSFHTARP